jgi:hypothetical protein
MTLNYPLWDKYSTVLRLLELQMRRYRKKVKTQVNTANSNSRTSNYRYSLFSEENPIIRIFCISGCLAVPINPDKWSSAVLNFEEMIPTGEKTQYSEETLSKCHPVQNKTHMNWSGIEPGPRRCLKHRVRAKSV